jgi:hypothetical protein
MPESVSRQRRGERVRARCGACAHVFTEEEWLALPLLETLKPEAISQYVLGWPVTQSIEIRCCSACGGGVARKEPREDPPDAEGGATSGSGVAARAGRPRERQIPR